MKNSFFIFRLFGFSDFFRLLKTANVGKNILYWCGFAPIFRLSDFFPIYIIYFIEEKKNKLNTPAKFFFDPGAVSAFPTSLHSL